MKRIGTLIAAACLLLLLLTACAQQTATESTASVSFDPAQVKTMADVFPFKETGDFQDATTETQYIFAFEADGVYYRAEADMPEGLFDEVMSIEYDEEHDAAVEKLLAPLEVTSLTNLSEQIPPQVELDKLVGTRTRAIERKLRSVEALDGRESDELLGISEAFYSRDED